MVDLIAGLPGDRLEDIRKSMDWILKHEAFDTLMLYPLASWLLPSFINMLLIWDFPHYPIHRI